MVLITEARVGTETYLIFTGGGDESFADLLLVGRLSGDLRHVSFAFIHIHPFIRERRKQERSRKDYEYELEKAR